LPGLADIGALIERIRGAGLAVEFDMSGSAQAVSATTGLAAYRVTQEALTNTLRHAGPGARAHVVVACDADAVRVSVSDDGRGLGATGSGGNGLRGMRQRVAMAGGRLTVGEEADGGVRVRAEIPVR
jgi:signal transduction histidine kinase